MCKRQLAKHYHDQSAEQLPSPVIGQSVRVNAHSQQSRSGWKPGVILENIAPRSYLVEVNGRTYRRNRVHLRDAVQSQTDSLPVQEPDPAQTPGLPENKPANNDHDLASNQPLLRKVPATSTSSNTVTPSPSSNVAQTRSGRSHVVQEKMWGRDKFLQKWYKRERSRTVVYKTSVSHFVVKNTKVKDTWEGKFKRILSFLLVYERRLFFTNFSFEEFEIFLTAHQSAWPVLKRSQAAKQRIFRYILYFTVKKLRFHKDIMY